MAILIIKITIQNDFDTGQPSSRMAEFIINSGGGPWYHYNQGNLPLTGNVQAMLDAEEADLWAQASANGQLATRTEIELAGQRAWYVNNSGTKAAVFDVTIAEAEVNITALVNAAFPTASAAVKTGFIRALLTAQFNTRYSAFEKDLV